MKVYYHYAATMVVAAGITFSGLKPAYGELVFEDDLNGKPATQSQDAGSEAQKRIEDQKNLSKSEMMRRQRMREELKNEDLLTQKLEELRLKDEIKRTDEILGSGISKKASEQQDGNAREALQEQRVGSATQVTQASERGAQANPALASTAVGGNGAPTESGANQTVALMQPKEESEEESNRVSITPRFGTGSITNSIYDVSAKLAAGLGIMVDVSDHIAFTAGYTYSSYSLGAGTAVSYGFGANNTYLQTVNMNDNVIDVGARGYLLGQRSKVRPFLGGGVAYRRGYVNYDDRTQKFLKSYYNSPTAAQDVEISGFAGYVETGLDFKITKAISLTGSFRYFNMFSSSQSRPLDPAVFLNQNGYSYYGYSGGLSPYYGALGSNGYSGYGYSNDVRSQASDALAKNNFYQLMAGVTVSF